MTYYPRTKKVEAIHFTGYNRTEVSDFVKKHSKDCHIQTHLSATDPQKKILQIEYVCKDVSETLWLGEDQMLVFNTLLDRQQIHVQNFRSFHDQFTTGPYTPDESDSYAGIIPSIKEEPALRKKMDSSTGRIIENEQEERKRDQVVNSAVINQGIDHKRSTIVLDNIQTSIGYSIGKLNLVALLGLIGEAGEVLNEVMFDFKKVSRMDNLFLDDIAKAIRACRRLESWKKDIRKQSYSPDIYVSVTQPDMLGELADVLYYLRAMARSFNINLDALSTLSVEKIETKQGVLSDVTHANVLIHEIKRDLR